jgi:ferric-dicitrate binding protein FerR (iron transport regulator)
MKENWEECLYRLARGEGTRVEKEELARWLAASDEHRRTFDTITRVVQDARLLRAGVDKERAWHRVRRRVARRALLARAARVAAAACIPLLVATAWLLLRPAGEPPPPESVTIQPGTTRATLYLSDGSGVDLQSPRPARVVDPRAARAIPLEGGSLNYHDTLLAPSPGNTHRIVVPRGGEYVLTLPDGTRAWLNAGTEIEFPLTFGPDSREVRLSGEAFFEVRKDPARPFITRANGARIEVTGTSFNLSCYPDEPATSVTVETGSVAFIAGGRTIPVRAGERGTRDARDGTMAMERVEVKYHTSWRHGTFYFHDTPLREITAMLGRWYDVTFDFADPSLEELRFSGAASRAREIDFILDLLSRAGSPRFIASRERVIRVERL